MLADEALKHRDEIEDFRRKHRTGLLTLVFTDMVGSTQIKQDLGDVRSVELIKRHHALAREVLAKFAEAEEIGTAGDSFFLVFVKPSDAARFALWFQSALRALSQEAGRPILNRIGIHIGEVTIEQTDASDPQRKDLYGIQVDIASRVMSLAVPGQITLTRAAFDNARQVLKGDDLPGIGALSWLNHGSYSLKGVDDPLEIGEVGETGLAPLQPPLDSEKARRHVTMDQEPVLGWRPACGQMVPNTKWLLERKLGEGGFGEVWLGRHQTLKEERVFKFCFHPEKARSLKREVTIFKLLNDRVGSHPNIVGVREVYFDEPPFYILMDYAPGSDMKSWLASAGTQPGTMLATKLEIVAQIADALDAAHRAGVLHRDVKPSNILVQGHEGQVHAKLTDFGVGQVMSKTVLADVTALGFTFSIQGVSGSSQAGSHLYMAPETVAGRPATPQSDLYSLGVVLYQLLVGELDRPVTADWHRYIEDRVLREDLEKCFAGEPAGRFATCGELASRLRDYEVRNRREAERMAIEIAEVRKSLLRGVIAGASKWGFAAAFAIFSALAGIPAIFETLDWTVQAGLVVPLMILAVLTPLILGALAGSACAGPIGGAIMAPVVPIIVLIGSGRMHVNDFVVASVVLGAITSIVFAVPRLRVVLKLAGSSGGALRQEYENRIHAMTLRWRGSFYRGLALSTISCLLVVAAYYQIENYRGRAAWVVLREQLSQPEVKSIFTPHTIVKIPDHENFFTVQAVHDFLVDSVTRSYVPIGNVIRTNEGRRVVVRAPRIVGRPNPLEALAIRPSMYDIKDVAQGVATPGGYSKQKAQALLAWADAGEARRAYEIIEEASRRPSQQLTNYEIGFFQVIEPWEWKVLVSAVGDRGKAFSLTGQIPFALADIQLLNRLYDASAADLFPYSRAAEIAAAEFVSTAAVCITNNALPEATLRKILDMAKQIDLRRDLARSLLAELHAILRFEDPKYRSRWIDMFRREIDRKTPWNEELATTVLKLCPNGWIDRSAFWALKGVGYRWAIESKALESASSHQRELFEALGNGTYSVSYSLSPVKDMREETGTTAIQTV